MARSCKRWTEDDKRIIREKYPRLGPTELQKELKNRTVMAIIQQAKYMQVRWVPSRFLTGEKFCGGCKKTKPANSDNFYVVHSRNTLSRFCKECSKSVDSGYYERDKINRLARAKQLRQTRRQQVIFHYSNGTMRCACCGESHLEFLTIDHIEGGGYKHRLSMVANREGNSLLNWIVKNNFPEGFRILCFNCNQVRGIYGYCPHEKEMEHGRDSTMPKFSKEPGLFPQRDEDGRGRTRILDLPLF